MADDDASAVDEMSDLFRKRFLCGKGGATGLAFFIGSPAWFRCVRKRDHDGECVMGLNEVERGVLEGTHEAPGLVVDESLDDYLDYVREKYRKARAAWNT